MTQDQQKNFFLANLGPEMCRFLSFKIKENKKQAAASKNRIFDIFSKLFLLSDVNLQKEIESFLDNLIYTNNITEKDINTYFYPIILKFNS